MEKLGGAADQQIENIAIIAARGGSKRVPKKNIRDFHGKPLIAWTIGNLLDSRLFSRVVVSTDSAEIAEVSVLAGASVPFMRPASLADDYSITAAVADHAIKSLIELGVSQSARFCVVYPAAVGVNAEDFAEGLELLASGGFDLVFAGCEFSPSPEQGWRKTGEHAVVPLDRSKQLTRTQDLPGLFYDAGQFYWSHYKTWKQRLNKQELRVGMLKIPRWRAIDIDTEEDWQFAERLFNPRTRSESID